MATIHENLLALVEAVTCEPARQIDLKAFQADTACDTLHCTLGLATTLPHFAAQGLVMLPAIDRRGPVVMVDGRMMFTIGADAALDRLFGEDSYHRLFEPREGGFWDGELTEHVLDKHLALARLNKQLELYR